MVNFRFIKSLGSANETGEPVAVNFSIKFNEKAKLGLLHNAFKYLHCQMRIVSNSFNLHRWFFIAFTCNYIQSFNLYALCIRFFRHIILFRKRFKYLGILFIKLTILTLEDINYDEK